MVCGTKVADGMYEIQKILPQQFLQTNIPKCQTKAVGIISETMST